jgi:bacillithiol system protein YtxJ
MGYLENFNQAQQGQLLQDWKELRETTQLDEIKADSKNKPVVIFKHSTRCGVSEGAKYALMDHWDFTGQELDFYYLDLLQYRAVSNQVAEDFGVTHQSPQLILVKDGKASFHTSHHRISVESLRKNL